MSDDIGQSVRDRLGATSAVTKLVPRDRIFADVLPSTEMRPSIVTQVTGNVAHEDLNTTNRIYQSTVLVLAYGRDRKECNAIAKVIRDSALPPNLKGSVNGMNWREVSLVDGPSEAVVEAPQDGSDKWRRATSQTFVIWNLPI